MAEKRTDGNTYTIIFAIIMVIVVGAILAFLASSLNDKISTNKKLESQQNILYAMGVNNNENPNSGSGSKEFVGTDNVAEKFDATITKQYILQGGEMKENPEAYLVSLKEQEQLAKDPNYQRKLPLFVGEKDGKEIYIIPMRGKGLWAEIWGYLGINKDMTVEGAVFDHASETPGLGANITERFFMDDFHGERLIDENNNFMGIKVAKGNMDPLNERKDDHKVDAIAGATITGDGVSAMIDETLEMYGPYLTKLSKEN